ncbi:MAG: 50S ribosomal protein L18 [Candidatus Micrarchaeia archaeon]
MGKATGPVYKVAFRRRRKNLTNYAKRLALVKGNVPRLVVRKSSSGVLVQFMNYSAKGDTVLASVHSRALAKYGWAPRCNAPTAYLCGLLAGKLAGKKGATAFILDVGMQTPSRGATVFAALCGAKDAKLSTNYTEEMIPEARLNGSVIEAYAKKLKSEDAAAYTRLYSSYAKQGFAPENMVALFKAAKAKIESE